MMHGRRARMEQIAAVTKQHENSQPPPTPEKDEGGESKDGSKDLEKSEPEKKNDDLDDEEDESGNESEGTTAEVEVPEEVNSVKIQHINYFFNTQCDEGCIHGLKMVLSK
jgi:hypothetical protein